MWLTEMIFLKNKLNWQHEKAAKSTCQREEVSRCLKRELGRMAGGSPALDGTPPVSKTSREKGLSEQG